MNHPLRTVLALSLLMSPIPALRAAPAPTTAAPTTTAPAAIVDLARVAGRGYAYLQSQQKPDGGWQNEADPPGVTALVLRGFVEDARFNTQQPFVKKGFAKLLSYQLDSGGIYKDLLANYNTAIAISALAASRDPAYKPALDKAVVYLRSLQWSDKIDGFPNGEKIDPRDARYGGFGYGKRGRPDLSNTQWAVEALADAGLKSDDPAFAAALKFATRCQNSSETNDQSWSADDGGFVYTDDSNAGPAGEYTGPDGRKLIRSYGSMTYAGLKSMIYAGLSKNDPRIKAAWGWIEKNYTVDENPGMGAAGPQNAKGGLYYYFYTMAKALHVYGEPTIIDADGVSHDWRVDLGNKIASLQKPDGSWAGDKRWMEDNPVLVSAYTLMAIAEIQQDLKEHPIGK